MKGLLSSPWFWLGAACTFFAAWFVHHSMALTLAVWLCSAGFGRAYKARKNRDGVVSTDSPLLPDDPTADQPVPPMPPDPDSLPWILMPPGGVLIVGPRPGWLVVRLAPPT